MSKINSLIVYLILFGISVSAQSRFNAGASFNIGFPVSSLSNIAKTGIGGSAIFEYSFSEKVSATLYASYQDFPGKGETFAVQGKAIDFSVNSIPVMLGARYYFSPELFGSIEAGANFLRVTADVYEVYSEEKISTDYEARYGGAIGLGYRYTMAEASVLEISGNYQLVEDNFNSFVLRLGILILLDKI